MFGLDENAFVLLAAFLMVLLLLCLILGVAGLAVYVNNEFSRGECNGKPSKDDAQPVR